VSRGTLAAALRVDKSVVGRWLTGTVRPSGHNLSRLSDYVAERVPGFSLLDWERPMDTLAGVLGVNLQTFAAPSRATGPIALPFPLIEESLATTTRRAETYEGFYRTTRPFARLPGRFIHDQVRIWRDQDGHLRFEMTAGDVLVQGWVWLLHNQMFVVAAEVTTGSFGYAILNGVSAVRAAVLDGIVLNCALDAERTPQASGIVLERIGELSGDAEADHARLIELGKAEPIAPEGSVPPEIERHLSQAVSGEWVLSLPVSRSMSRGV